MGSALENRIFINPFPVIIGNVQEVLQKRMIPKKAVMA